MRLATIAACCIAFSALAVESANQAKPKASPDRKQLIEMHQKMAELHRKAADCLKAGKDIQACQDEMAKECPMAKSGDCPFMGQGCPMGGRGMRGRGRRMRGSPAPASQTPPDNPAP